METTLCTPLSMTALRAPPKKIKYFSVKIFRQMMAEVLFQGAEQFRV